jgi:predicted Ser/Thr protein kinase
MARYEAAVVRAVHDLRGVPRLLGFHGRAGLLKEYVPGEPLTRHTNVDRRFFRQFFRLLRSIHRRGIAYVDLEKAENIMLGQDGLPYLIDFQVAFYLPERFGGCTWPARLMRRLLQRADMYHARKHFRRLLRDELSPRQIACLRRKPWFVRLGNVLHAPYKKLRRWLLANR